MSRLPLAVALASGVLLAGCSGTTVPAPDASTAVVTPTPSLLAPLPGASGSPSGEATSSVKPGATSASPSAQFSDPFPSPTKVPQAATPWELAVVPEGVDLDPSDPDGVVAVRDRLEAEVNAMTSIVNDTSYDGLTLDEVIAYNRDGMARQVTDHGFVKVDPEVYIDSRMVTGPIWYPTYNFMLMAVPYRYGICEAILEIAPGPYTRPAMLCGMHEEFDKRAVELGVTGPGKPIRDLAKTLVTGANERIDAGAMPSDAFSAAAGAAGLTMVDAAAFPAGPDVVPAGGRLASVVTGDETLTYRLALGGGTDQVACIMTLSTDRDGTHVVLGMKDAPVCTS